MIYDNDPNLKVVGRLVEGIYSDVEDIHTIFYEIDEKLDGAIETIENALPEIDKMQEEIAGILAHMEDS